ncbi:AI-2E family transporter [Neolewinella aurantiaca]|uniref:AI-2E family transporter n=1 Tax=Neolewinella aurantiaca TaxID=2602767 RepID=A0A5C7FLE2_9BACT|nr:AI-2E family transporter [Neolewinella aurantiaca]TXF90871.1 AI-2E family transporter [Neolewinella aurantiaca]
MAIQRVAAWLITIALILVLIVVGKDYLVPIFMALVIWYLVNALDREFNKLPWIGKHLPGAVTLGMSLIFIGLTIYIVGDTIVETIQGFVVDSNKYIPKIDAQIARMYEQMGIDDPPTVEGLELSTQLWAYSAELLNGFTNFARALLLVLLYVLFFLIEQGAFGRKMAALGLPLQETNRLSVVLSKVNDAMRTYLGVKTFTSMLTALLSWIVFYFVGVDYALFWAFLVFLFNYVPTIGSITATLLPGFLALVQFDTLSPFLVIIIGVTAIQLLVGNILEPRLMGDNLNISPLVVVLSLILWSMLWGVIGMLLSVPITVAIIIVCSQFETTRTVAVLLSKDGKV